MTPDERAVAPSMTSNHEERKMAGELVTVATFSTLTEAEAAKVTLEAEGIRTLLDDMDWQELGMSIPNIKLQVSQEDAGAAAELLAHHGHTLRDDTPDDDDAPDPITCLECGKEIPEGQSKCPACGWTYAG
jgi:hypothetical protein